MLLTTLTFKTLAAYLRPAPTNASTARIYDVDHLGRELGRLVYRPEVGWFASNLHRGVVRDDALEVRYFTTPEAALAAIA